DSALHMPIGKDLGSPDVGEDEVEIGRLEALVHVPTVRVKSEHVLEVAKRNIRWRGRRFGDVGRHVLPAWLRGRDNALRPFGRGVADPTKSGRNPPMQTRARKLGEIGPGLVAVLAYDGLCTFELGIAVEVFGLPRPEFDFPWYDFRVVSGEGRRSRAT